MTITTDVGLKQYVKLMFMLAYRKPLLIGLVTFDLLMMAWVLSYYMKWLDIPEPEYPQYLAIGFITFVQPVAIYFTIRRNYNTSIRLSGPVKITFTHEKIILKGEQFCEEYLWRQEYKLVEFKNWFLIYQNTLAAILIDKADLSPKEQQEFKALVKSIKGLKKEGEW